MPCFCLPSENPPDDPGEISTLAPGNCAGTWEVPGTCQEGGGS